MTIYAAATVTGSDIQIDGDGSVHYRISLSYVVTDGVTRNLQSGLIVRFPIVTSQKKGDKLIREAVSADILSSFGWSIDPDDIYFPAP